MRSNQPVSRFFLAATALRVGSSERGQAPLSTFHREPILIKVSANFCGGTRVVQQDGEQQSGRAGRGCKLLLFDMLRLVLHSLTVDTGGKGASVLRRMSTYVWSAISSQKLG